MSVGVKPGALSAAEVLRGMIAGGGNLCDGWRGRERFDLRRKRFWIERRPWVPLGRHARAMAIGLAALASPVDASHAQGSWVFNDEIPCATAPVYGLPFGRCWASDVRAFRIGRIQSWRLTLTDARSEVAIGLYRLVEAHGVGGLSPVSGSNAVEWLRTADPLRNLTAGAGNWAYTTSRAGDHYVTFSRAQRQCIGFVRNGSGVPGQLNWILGAAFCRESATPISPNEAEFIADAIRVRE